MNDDRFHIWFRPNVYDNAAVKVDVETRRVEQMLRGDRIIYLWYGAVMSATVRARYPHGPNRTELHLADDALMSWGEESHDPVTGLVHTFDNGTLFYRALPDPPPPHLPDPRAEVERGREPALD